MGVPGILAGGTPYEVACAKGKLDGGCGVNEGPSLVSGKYGATGGEPRSLHVVILGRWWVEPRGLSFDSGSGIRLIGLYIRSGWKTIRRRRKGASALRRRIVGMK